MSPLVRVPPAESLLLKLIVKLSELPSGLLSATLTLKMTLLPSSRRAVPPGPALFPLNVSVRMFALAMATPAAGSLKESEPFRPQV